MIRIDIDEAKLQLSGLMDEAIHGQEVVITRAGQPLVKLVAVEEAIRSRRLGAAAGKVWMSEDFDDPLPDFSDY